LPPDPAKCALIAHDIKHAIAVISASQMMGLHFGADLELEVSKPHLKQAIDAKQYSNNRKNYNPLPNARGFSKNGFVCGYVK
jgi:hypothetical protein